MRDEQIVGPTLVGKKDVVVDGPARPAPRHRDRPLEWEPKLDRARPFVIGRGVGLVDRKRENDEHQGEIREHLPTVDAVFPPVGRTERSDEEQRRCRRERDRTRIPQPQPQVTGSGAKRQCHDEVHREHGGHDAHPPVDRLPLGEITLRERPQSAPGCHGQCSVTFTTGS